MAKKITNKASPAPKVPASNVFTRAIIGIISIFWLAVALLAAFLPAPRFPTLHDKRICLLIAHPDDEAMFFSPSLLALSQPYLNNKIFILCLSSGDADGLGHIRKQELVKSALQLGITRPEHVVTIEDDRFPDSMTTDWDAEEVSKVLKHYFAPKAASATPPLPVLIDALITFDKNGVSGHPNHKSLYYGAATFVKSMHRSGWDAPIKLYTLTTTNIVRKYSGLLDGITTVVMTLVGRKQAASFPSPLLSISGPSNIRKAQLAMTTAHQSQMRWFRWAWITISRYMYVNDLVRAVDV